jgi:hypothetical protein
VALPPQRRDRVRRLPPRPQYPLNDDGTSKLRDANTIEVKAVDRAGNETESAGRRNWNADTSIRR